MHFTVVWFIRQPCVSILHIVRYFDLFSAFPIATLSCLLFRVAQIVFLKSRDLISITVFLLFTVSKLQVQNGRDDSTPYERQSEPLLSVKRSRDSPKRSPDPPQLELEGSNSKLVTV